MKAQALVITWVCIIACRSLPVSDLGNRSHEIWSADSAMSALAAEIGFNTAVLRYADSSIVKLSEGKAPIIGIQNFAASFDQLRDIKTIAWTPQFAEVAESGELGYTWGTWKLNLPDTIQYGKYFTVWKKNMQGEWKVVLDGGNSGPAPGN
jgi:ketosteroid isomerase-like protein